MNNAEYLISEYKNLVKKVPKNLKKDEWVDAVHEAYIKMSKLSTPIENPKAYTEISIKNAYYNQKRGAKNKIVNRVIDLDDMPELVAPDLYNDELFTKEQIQKLYSLIDAMPPKRKKIMELYLTGIPVIEIHKKLKANKETTNRQFNIAKAYLKSHRKDFLAN